MSGFLVINTISAILAQQTRQIGMMKAVGARDRQVAGIYLGIVIAYALLALAVAIPLGALGAWALTQFTAGPRQLRGDRVLHPARGARPRGRDRAGRPAGGRRVAGLARRPGDGPRGRRQRRHQRRLRAQPLRPRAPVDPRPVPPDAAVHPQHVPAQGPAHPHARGADARRRRVHERVHAPGEPRRDDQRDARLLQLQRPGGPRDAGPDADPRPHRRAGPGRRGGGAVDVRERPARPAGRLHRQHAHRVRAARRREDGAAQARGGPLPRAGRRQRARRHPQLPR